jgi:hypothetical protein
MAQKKLEDYTVEELYASRKKLSTLFGVFAGLMLALTGGFAYTFFFLDKEGANFLLATPLLAFSGLFVILLSQRSAIDKELARRREGKKGS